VGRRDSAKRVRTPAEKARQLVAIRQASLIAAGRDGQRAARVAHPERSSEVDAVEPPGDETGAEGIARTDRIDHDRHGDAWLVDGVAAGLEG